MNRLPTVDPATATGPAAALFPAVKAVFGAIPNFAKSMANSPALLKGYLDLFGALSAGVLPYVLREKIALAIAEANACAYCLSAHSYLARNVANLPGREIEAARRATSGDQRTAAALRFAVLVNSTRGNVADAEVAVVRRAGFSDEEIAEIAAHVALNTLTNSFNSLAGVEVDFPVVTPGSFDE